MCRRGGLAERVKRSVSRRAFITSMAATAAASLLHIPAAFSRASVALPADTGRARYVIRGGFLLSMDPAVGEPISTAF